MRLLAALVVLALLAIPVWLVLRRSTELFCIRVRGGRARFVRGRIPPRLLEDVRDVLRSVERAEVRAVVENGRPRVVADGISDGTLQQLRNVVGTWQLVQIRAGKPPR